MIFPHANNVRTLANPNTTNQRPFSYCKSSAVCLSLLIQPTPHHAVTFQHSNRTIKDKVASFKTIRLIDICMTIKTHLIDNT